MSISRFRERPSVPLGIPLIALSMAPRTIQIMRVVQWGLSAVIVVSVLFAGWMWNEMRTMEEETARYATATARTEVLTRQLTAELEREHLTLSAAQLTAIQQEVRFVHQLAEKRGFSWTQLLADLEEALPAGTSIGKIQRDVKTSTITIDGHGTNMEALKALMTALSSRPSFRQPILHHHQLLDAAHTEGAGDRVGAVEFSVTVQYRRSSGKVGSHDVS